MDLNEVVAVLKERRWELKLSQEQVAKDCGILTTTLVKIENYQSSPQFEKLNKIAERLGYEFQLVKKE